MALVSLEDAKAYLRVDSSYEDSSVIAPLLAAAEALCRDTARLSQEEWDSVVAGTGEGTVEIRGEERDASEVGAWKDILRVAVLFTLGYFYEHREDADHHAMARTLRNLLFSVREGAF